MGKRLEDRGEMPKIVVHQVELSAVEARCDPIERVSIELCAWELDDIQSAEASDEQADVGRILGRQ